MNKEGAQVSEVRHSCGYIKAIHSQLCCVIFNHYTIKSKKAIYFFFFK